MQEVQTILPNGTIVQERYVVEDLLGKGGFGAVYLVKDMRVKGNLFALKEVIDPNKQDRQRFIFEGDVLKRLDHKALPRVYRAFESDKQGRAYILMDYIEGPNLEVLRQRQPAKRFSLSQVLAIMDPIMEAVSYLHHQRPPIIHRDIKPANIIALEASNEAVLVDFGIAKEYDPESTTTAIRRCSPGYGAPEQYGTGTNSRTDIYGLAATVYSLLTGVVPIDALYRLTQIGSKGSDPLEPVTQIVPEIPASVSDAIHKAMAIDVNARYATVEEFRQTLLNGLAEQKRVAASALPAQSLAAVGAATAVEDITTKVVPAHAQAQPSRSRNRLALLLLIFVLLAGVASAMGILYFTTHQGASANGVTPVPQPQHTVVPTATATHALTPTPRPTATASPQSSPTSSATAPPIGGTFPQLAGGYSGQIHNAPANVTKGMTLSPVHQSQGTINGQFNVAGPELIGSGPFSGTVDTQGNVSFTVTSSGVRPLLFTGTINKDGSISGSYCSLDGTNHCNHAVGGFGTWRVQPVPPGSGSIGVSTSGRTGDRRNDVLSSFSFAAKPGPMLLASLHTALVEHGRTV
ncbi:MAG: protein kinase [Chloroflexota bacterium]|nr:protein kinase [Chloroflexota bacterium]